MKLYQFQCEFITELLQTEKIASDPGMSVYQHAACIVRINTLHKIFPCCEKIVGTDCFNQLALEYITQHEINAAQLSQAGKDLPDFIKHHTINNSVPYLADLAHLEWLWNLVFHAKNNRLSDFVDNVIDIHHTTWQHALGAKLYQSEFALFEIWKMCQPEYQGDYQVHAADACYLMIIAVEENMHLLNLTAAEYTVLSVLKTPQAFTTICECLPQLSAVEIEKTLLALFHRYAIIPMSSF